MPINSIWILMDTSKHIGQEAVVGTFTDKPSGMKFIATYVLENTIDTTYLHFFEREVMNHNRRASDHD